MARTVLVTGGGTGIGRAVAAVFAADGNTVIVTGRRAAPLQTTAADLGTRVRPVVCDGTDPAQVDALRAELPESVDVVVHCAGGNTDFDRPAPHDLASLAANWQANLNANLLSAVLTTAAVSDRLTDGGTIINIGSIAADKGTGQSRGCILEHRPRRRARPQGHHRERRVPRLHRRHRILPRPARR